MQSFQLIIIGLYTCQVFWKGDPGVENVIMRFATESEMEIWCCAISAQRRGRASVSETIWGVSESKWMRDMWSTVPNPYAVQDDDDTDDEDVMNQPSVAAPPFRPPLRFPKVPPPISELKHRPTGSWM